MIGKLKKVPLREIWKNEAKDFTTWLENNIDALSEVLDLNLTITGRERRVGGFFLDLLAEDFDGKPVIIENQLEKTNHDHLGKIITYMTNLGAQTAIWISSNPCQEHIKAVSWLNESTPSGVSFYLIKVEAVRIEGSDPAPLFTVVVEPTPEAKEIGREKYSERDVLIKDFWKSLLAKAREKTQLHSNSSFSTHHWVGIGAGKTGLGYNYIITNNRADCELYIDTGDKESNKSIFDKLYSRKQEIENIFGDKLEWQRLDERKSSRIRKSFKIGLRDKDKQNELQDKMIDAMIHLEKAFGNFIRELE